ncbi:hypothetical protein K438DRAFT_2016296 [Mycena galopus ATCC 62051]|nr:hypothetical protein K438DRAFT_2016296 [Mycena galopus ATCC 62051]
MGFPFFHHCAQPHSDLDVLFPFRKTCYSIPSYIDSFFFSIRGARTITKTFVCSVKYCRTRGPTSYPFIIVRLRHPEFWNCGILMKLEGEDSDEKTGYLTLGKADQTVRGLVGTWRYDSLQTVSFPRRPGSSFPPTLADIITLAELTNQQDSTRAGFPEVFFSAMKVLFTGVVSGGAKCGSSDAASLTRPGEAKSAVINAFPVRQERMLDRIGVQCYRTLKFYTDPEEPEEPESEAEAEMDAECTLAREIILEERVCHQ